jgi:hypothetical protein
MWEGHSEDNCETGRDCSGWWVADILNIDMTVTIYIKIKAITNVTNVVKSVIPWMINVVNGLRFLTLGFFL